MKKIMILILFMSCGAVKTATETPVKVNGVMQPQSQYEIQPGMVRLVHFQIPDGATSSNLNCKSIHYPIFKDEHLAYSFVAETYFSDLKPFDCTVAKGKENLKVVSFTVKAYQYKEEKLNVDQKKVSLSQKDLMRVQKEQEVLNAVYAKGMVEKYFEEPFILPIDSALTSIYGTKRVFNNERKTQHLGSDFRAKVGEKIRVANRGKVVLTDDLFFTGRVVIVDHGLNIFTVYAHLSEIHVSVGHVLNRGDVIGLSGASGRVSGPHLHWGVKVSGNWIDGFSLKEESEKVFKEKLP